MCNSTYKLIYCNSMGYAEVIRQLFVLAGEDFEDYRFPSGDVWKQHKEHQPFKQIPVLVVDGQKLPQSQAIIRFLSRRFGFAGKTPFEEAMVDAVGDQIRDFYQEVYKYLRVKIDMAKGDLEELTKTDLIPARDKHFPIYSKLLRENKAGFLVGDSITFADVHLAHLVSYLNQQAPGIFDQCAEINAHLEKIHSIPELKKWLDTRIVTNF